MATSPPNDAAWIYTRRSRVSVDQASIEDQETHGRAALDEHGWHLAGVLSEEVSASRYGKKERGDWAELLRLVEAGEVGVLVLWESNRGDRTLTTWSAFLDLCRDKGTCIYVVSHERLYNPRNHRDWKNLATDGVDNAYFSEQLSVSVTRGKRGAMAKGRPQSPVPYGYAVRYNPETGRTAGWVMVPEEAEIVREISRRVRAAEPIGRIVTDLLARGVPGPTAGTSWKDGTPKSGVWLRGTVRGIAANHAYAGLVRLGDGRYAERQAQKDGAEWPPIVTRTQWEDAVAVVSSRATGPRPGAAVHLLSGIARCECGGWLRGAPRDNGYRCRNSDMHIQMEVLDNFVRNVICERLSRDDALDMFVRDDTPQIAILESEIKEWEARRTAARKMFARGTIGEDALQEIEDEIAPEIDRREREISASRKVPALSEAINSGNVRAWWDRQEVQARREVIAAVTGITVRKVPGGRKAPRSAHEDLAARVVFDWKQQSPKRRGPDAGRW
jgi:DNA invertase Pin-like site-specific DNA recombinase